MKDVKLSNLQKILSSPRKETSGDEVRYCCPFCSDRGKTPDTDYHLYLNKKTHFYFCHRCGASGRAVKSDVDYSQDTLGDLSKKLFSIDNTEEAELNEDERIVYPVNLPDNEPIAKGSPAFEYLERRGISQADIDFWDIRLMRHYPYNRILFPDYVGTTPVYWVSRSYVPLDKSPKYINGGQAYYCSNCRDFVKIVVDGLCGVCDFPVKDLNSNARSRGYIFGLYRRIESGCLTNSYITVVEGIISAIRARHNSVATLGKLITKRQLELLASLAKKYNCEIVLSLDGDALQETIKYAKYFSENACKISVVLFEREQDDPASVKDYDKLFNNRVRINSSIDLLNLNLCYKVS